MKLFACTCIAMALMSGCTQPTVNEKIFQDNATTQSGEPGYISLKHCLIGFAGSIPRKEIARSKEEAEKLANELMERAKGGEDFDAIIAEYTDDSAPGIYNLANTGFQADLTSNDLRVAIYPRSKMVPGFGNTGFQLKVGEFGMAEYHPHNSPYGWHILLRTR